MKNMFIKKLFIYILFVITLCLFTLIFSMFIINNNYSNNTIRTISFIIGILAFLILGLMKGLFIKKNGLLEGLLSGTLVMFITLIINLIANIPFVTSNIVKISVYIISSTIGGIIGVNISKQKK